MSEPTGGLASLGLNGKIFVAQLINFGVILFVFAKWVYRPLVKVMDDRAKKIQQGLSDAGQARLQLQEAEQQRKIELHKAHQEAETLGVSLRQAAKEKAVAMVERAKKEAEAEIRSAQEKLSHERAEMMAALRLELADLIGLATEKVTLGALTPEAHRELIRKAIAELPQREGNR